jgi:F-type H+-transporting ATPase subunit epsilon
MLKLEIVTPEKRVLETDADSVTVPTATGEAGILPSHAPLISAVRPGILTYTAKGASDKLAVSAGFVEVNGDKVAVLVDTAETADEIDLDAAKAARETAEKASAAAGLVPDEEATAQRDSVDHAAARIQLASGR